MYKLNVFRDIVRYKMQWFLTLIKVIALFNLLTHVSVSASSRNENVELPHSSEYYKNPRIVRVVSDADKGRYKRSFWDNTNLFFTTWIPTYPPSSLGLGDPKIPIISRIPERPVPEIQVEENIKTSNLKSTLLCEKSQPKSYGDSGVGDSTYQNNNYRQTMSVPIILTDLNSNVYYTCRELEDNNSNSNSNPNPLSIITTTDISPEVTTVPEPDVTTQIVTPKKSSANLLQSEIPTFDLRFRINETDN